MARGSAAGRRAGIRVAYCHGRSREGNINGTSTACGSTVIINCRSAHMIIGHTVRQGLAAVVLLAALPTIAWSADGAGTIRTLFGSATVTKAASGLALPIAAGQRVYAGDRIATGPDSYVGIMLNDDTRLTLGPGSELV